jgi:hypothetical protein
LGSLDNYIPNLILMGRLKCVWSIEMILKGDIIAAHDIIMGREVDPEMKDEWVGVGRVIWEGGDGCSIGE